MEEQKDQRIVIAVDLGVPGGLDAARRSARQLSYDLQESVTVLQVTSSRMRGLRGALEGGIVSGQAIRPTANASAAAPVSAAPMSAAPFIWREDGRPDWGNMWQGFCELALFGGPPHRGEESALHAPAAPSEKPTSESEAIAEIQRGIFETTGLKSETAEPGWLAVQCDSTRMAAWLCATILLENVDARCEGDRLLVPASPDFELKDQVKSVITVLAKTHHYWSAHLAEPNPNNQPAAVQAR